MDLLTFMHVRKKKYFGDRNVLLYNRGKIAGGKIDA